MSGKVNQEIKNGHFFCPFLKSGLRLLEKPWIGCIIENYRLPAQKNFFILLA
jgi:hypothetical protein